VEGLCQLQRRDALGRLAEVSPGLCWSRSRSGRAWAWALLAALALGAGGRRAQAFELDANAWAGAKVPAELADHLGAYRRLYMDLYLLSPPEAGGGGPRLVRIPASLPPEWSRFIGTDCPAKGVQVIALVSNQTLSLSHTFRTDGLDTVFGDTRWGRWAIDTLVAMALQDHVQGLAVHFQGSDPGQQVPFLNWFRALAAAAKAKGLEVDAELAVQYHDDDNAYYAGIQSYRGLGGIACQALFGPGSMMIGPGGGSGVVPAHFFQDALDYARQRLPQDRGVLTLDVGGRLWRNGTVHALDKQAWKALLAQAGAPDRMEDGRLTVDTGNGLATYMDAAALAHWIIKSGAAGLGGVCLEPAGLVDPGFWRWWDMNKASLAGTAAAP